MVTDVCKTHSECNAAARGVRQMLHATGGWVCPLDEGSTSVLVVRLGALGRPGPSLVLLMLHLQFQLQTPTKVHPESQGTQRRLSALPPHVSRVSPDPSPRWLPTAT